VTGGSQRRRTGRPNCEPDSVEQGLRDLATGRGPELLRLTSPHTDGLRALMGLTAGLEHEMPVEERARAVLQHIKDLIAGLGAQGHPQCEAALRAAFRLDPEVTDSRKFSTLASRLERIREAGAFGVDAGPEAGKRNWGRAVHRLAGLVEDHLDNLRVQAGWAAAGPASGHQPFRVRRLVVTYFLKGQVVTDVITERSVEATEDGVDRYIVRDYVEGDPGARIDVHTWLNCKRGAQAKANLGSKSVAVKAEILLPDSYLKGSGCTFATHVTRQGITEPTTWQEIQVTSHGIDSLTMRVQFDTEVPVPTRCWYFAEAFDVGRLEPPDPDEERDLKITSMGFAAHHFGVGRAQAKYGMVWTWPEDKFDEVFDEGRDEHEDA